jgi:hypothetical protein
VIAPAQSRYGGRLAPEDRAFNLSTGRRADANTQTMEPYQTMNHSAWTEKALLESFGVLASALLGHVVAGLFT